jgi:hypothetical protein
MVEAGTSGALASAMHSAMRRLSAMHAGAFFNVIMTLWPPSTESSTLPVQPGPVHLPRRGGWGWKTAAEVYTGGHTRGTPRCWGMRPPRGAPPVATSKGTQRVLLSLLPRAVFRGSEFKSPISQIVSRPPLVGAHRPAPSSGHPPPPLAQLTGALPPPGAGRSKLRRCLA